MTSRSGSRAKSRHPRVHRGRTSGPSSRRVSVNDVS